MFLNSFLRGFFNPLICYALFAEKVHPLRNALIRYGVTFDNNVTNLVTLAKRAGQKFLLMPVCVLTVKNGWFIINLIN